MPLSFLTRLFSLGHIANKANMLEIDGNSTEATLAKALALKAIRRESAKLSKGWFIYVGRLLTGKYEVTCSPHMFVHKMPVVPQAWGYYRRAQEAEEAVTSGRLHTEMKKREGPQS